MSIWESTEGVVTSIQTVKEIFFPHDYFQPLRKRRIEEEG
jgi:hypothetical protein